MPGLRGFLLSLLCLFRIWGSLICRFLIFLFQDILSQNHPPQLCPSQINLFQIRRHLFCLPQVSIHQGCLCQICRFRHGLLQACRSRCDIRQRCPLCCHTDPAPGKGKVSVLPILIAILTRIPVVMAIRDGCWIRRFGILLQLWILPAEGGKELLLLSVENLDLPVVIVLPLLHGLLPEVGSPPLELGKGRVCRGGDLSRYQLCSQVIS